MPVTAPGRRALLRALFACGVSAAAATVLVPVGTASVNHGRLSRPGSTDGRAPGPLRDVPYDGTYRGSHTRGRQLGAEERTDAPGPGAPGRSDGHGAGGPSALCA